MPVYPPNVMLRFLSPSFAGNAVKANGRGTSASFECGSFTRISLTINDASKMITEARFETNGCGYMVASADVIAEKLTGRELTQLHSVDEMEFVRLVEAELGGFPVGRGQCCHVVLEALRSALADHRSQLIDEFEFTGEKALVCTCFGVSEEVIEACIAKISPDSVDDVIAECRAGSGCGSCQMLIQEMIDSHQNGGRA